jgi:2-polyprenyl-3-methyl-5-hydroxy-6-metoxy-1,4-benzoquinol methylase
MNTKTAVQEKYASAAREITNGRLCSGVSSCCSCDPITGNIYDFAQTGSLPEKAVLASLGCGNPTALTELKPGETVLDLGSGGGIDVLLSAQRVGPSGMAYGLDMTDDMLELARENQRQAGVKNVEFLKGEIENIPLGDGTVDVVISNCVINLSADKARVLAEAFRVLRPGGRLGISDVIADHGLDPCQRTDAEQRVGCTSGTLTQPDYRDLLRTAGFTGISITTTHDAGGGLHSAIIKAAKPATQIR